MRSRMSSWFGFITAVAGFLSLFGSIAAADYPTGFDGIEVIDPVSQKPVRAAIWYPASQTGPGTQLGRYQLAASRDLPLAEGPFPLAILSHGNGGSHLGHRDTAQALASHGYIVIAPLHAGDNFQDKSLLGKDILLSSRPKSISILIDALLKDERYPIDPSRIGFIGFSAGGYTGLVLAGAAPSLGQAPYHCKDHPQDGFCQYVFKRPGQIEKLDHLADKRIGAAVLMAPLTAHHTDQSFDDLFVPLFLIQAEYDQVLVPPFHAARLKDHPRTQEFWTIEDAQHFSFLAPFPDALKAELGELATDAEGFDRVEMHRILNQRIIDFLNQNL